MLDMSSILLNVKFNSSSTCSVDVNLSDDLHAVKQKISKKLNIPVDEIQIILAGKVIEGNKLIKELCLGNHTVLHAFRQKQKYIPVDVDVVQTGASGDQGTKDFVHHYFVYCKVCKCLQPGKLRVMCAACKDGHIILNREPENYDDVLLPDRITVDCKNDQCSGGKQNAKFYFKCSAHEGEETAILKHIYPNTKNVECITCCELSSPVLVFPCERGHVMCIECFTSYCIISLNDRMFVEDEDLGYSLPCPAGCENSLIQEAHHFCLIGEDQYERFKHFGTEEFVLKNDGVLCPAPGCGAGFIVEYPDRKVICPSCRFAFCHICRNGNHGDTDCSLLPLLPSGNQLMDQNEEITDSVNVRLVSPTLSGSSAHEPNYTVSEEQEMRARWDRESLQFIGKSTKSCPECKARTEKDGGCMHMTCSRCKFEWCWLCEKRWNRDCQGDHWFD